MEQNPTNDAAQLTAISDFTANNEPIYMQFGNSEPILIGYKPKEKEFMMVLKEGNITFKGKHPGEEFKIFVKSGDNS